MTVTIHVGGALDRLRKLPSDSIHCCVTSPPYWGLRAYGGDEGMIGMEPTFDEHLASLVAVFDEVRRVLRPDGTFWLNVGDAYAGGGSGASSQKQTTNRGSYFEGPTDQAGAKAKDLMMMPARIALALRADGWWLRSEIIWHKPNPMPESVTDRPTSAHEKLFLFSKSPKYFYDAAAVRTPALPVSVARVAQGVEHQAGSNRAHGGTKNMKAAVGRPLVDKQRGHSRRHDGFNDKWDQMTKEEQQSMGANLRNVWSIPTAGYRDAHFATFPPAVVEPCIEAGTSAKGVCAECGAPLTCACDTDTEPVPATVLDPFGGSGTVGLVADRLQRDAVLIEINADYAAMAYDRIRDDDPMFSDVVMNDPKNKE